MKRKITKAEYDALHEELKKHYKQDGDNYVLQIDDDDDIGALRRAKEREVENARVARERVKEVEKELQALKDGNARSSGDVATLEKSWQKKLEDREAELGNKLSAKDKYIKESLIKGNVKAISAKLAGDNAFLLEAPIKERLSVDFSGDEPVLRVLDKDGKPSAMNLEDLEKEIVADKRFSSIIIASRASGGAGRGGNGNGSSSSGASDKKFHELTDAERREWYQRDKAGFLAASQKAAEEAAESRRARIR